MKPGSRSVKTEILISGEELEQLKRHSGEMVEAFGLNRKVEKYQGKRPIGFYRWDMDCLIDVLDMALDDPREYPDRNASDYIALRNLSVRLKELYEKNYEK